MRMKRATIASVVGTLLILGSAAPAVAGQPTDPIGDAIDTFCDRADDRVTNDSSCC